MKPNFALSLSFEGIGLLMRAGDGWRVVGETPVDVPDLRDVLARIRARAAALGGGEIRSKLVIPNEQIRYLEAAVPPSGDPAAAVEAALEGATPYAVEDLVWDWAEAGGRLHIATIARETLDEAEDFASEHGFNPVIYVAIPPENSFEGEVSFGETRLAADLLGPDEQVVRDALPIAVLGPVADPEPEETAPKAPEETADRPTADPGPRDPHPEKATASNGAQEPAPVPDTEPEQAPDADASSGPPREPAPETKIGIEPAEKPVAPAFASTRKDEGKAAQTADTGASAEEPPELPAPLFGSRREAASRDASLAHDPAPPPPPVPGFSSIRASRDDSTGKAPRLNGVDRHGNGATAPEIPVPANVAPSAAGDATPVPGLPDPANQSAPAAAEAPPAPEPAAAAKRRFGRASKETDKTGRAAAATGATDTVPPDPQEAAARERQRMTVFGQRDKQNVGGKPRYLGLMLTALLLLFLAGVAAWASIFVDDGLARFFGRDNSPILTDESPAEPAEPALRLASLPDADEPVDPDVERTVSDALRQPQRPAEPVLSPAEADARYAATGIWQMAPQPPAQPQPTDLDELYVASIDGRVATHDAVALPDPTHIDTDLAIAAPRLPPPAGVRYKVDARGLIVPSPEGVVTPDGITLVRGQPAVIPPPRPGETLQQPRTEAPGETVQEAVDRARLSEARPRARPEGLVEGNERSRLGGRSRIELSGLRPRLRPESKKAEVESADESPTRLAIAASPQPKPRPKAISRIVARAQREAPEKKPETRVAAVAPRTVQPRIPSSTSVAKQATVRNAIRLNRINLIGVYGKPSSRRALVRLASGRYKKVKVGDRIDGGRISAIGESQLKYTKGGRSITLKMPKG